MTDEERKKWKEKMKAAQHEASKQAEKNAAAAFKAAGKTQGSGSKNTTKKTSTYSNKTAKQNSTVTKGKVDKKGKVKKQSNIRARATQATKNYISGKSSNASGKKLTGTEKLRNSAGWNMTQEERFLKQRQYQRTAADTSKNKYKSITANAKDEADTRETIAKNYNKYAAQTARQAKENADKYRKTGEDKYLDQAKSDLNRARTFEHQRDWAVTTAFQARQDAAFQETASKYDKYLKDTNPEYKAEDSLSNAKDRLEKAKKDMQDLQGLMSPLAMSKKSNQEKLKKAQKELDSAKKAYDKLVKNAETTASDKYKEMFGDLTSDVDKQKLKDEAERLINLEAPTQSQQAEIRVIKKMYDQLPADEKDRRVQDRLYANSGTTLSRITQTIGAGVSSTLAELERLPEFIEGLNETTSRDVIGGGEGMKPYMPEGAADSVSLVDSEDLEKKRQKAMEWLDKQATKSEKKAEARRTNAQQNASELGKAAVDLGITLTQVGLDTLAGGQGKALAMMGARVLGGTYHEAKESGADTDDAVLYAGLQATKEVLSEKIFGAALPVYGKGMARSLESAIERAVDKAAMRAATKAGERATKFFFQSLANFVEEGGEELVSGAFDPLVRAVTIGDKSDLKAYVPGTEEFQAWTDDLVDQFIMGGLAGFIGGAVTQVGQGLPGVDAETRTEIEKERAAKSFTPTQISDFSQSLIDNGIKNKAAVNADTVITNLVTNEAEVSDKQINKMLDDLHITKKGAKTSGAQRNLTALKNRLGLTELDDNISRADLVKAIREGAKIAKQNADMQTDADVRGMEEQQEANQVGAEVDDAEQNIADAERSQQTITIGDETLTHDQYAERMQALAEADGNVLTDEQINTLWDQAVSEFGTPVKEEAPPQQIEGQMDLFGEMGRTEDEEAKFLEDTFGIKSDDEGQMNMFDAMDEDTFKEQTFGIKKQKDEMETLAEETQRKQNSVLEKNEAADKLAPETQEDLNTLAGNIGYRIEVHDHIDDPRGAADMENAIINGYIDKDTGTIHIAMDATDDIETTRSRILKVVAIHETTHGLETLAPEEYQAYSDYVENNWDVLNDGEDFATALENKMKQYADAGQDIGEIGARQELMAEFASHMDQDAIFDFVSNNPTVGQKIVNMFREIVSRLKETFGMAGDAETALRKWERAYQAAVKGTANVNNDTQVDEAYRAGVEVQDSDGEPVAIMSEDGQAQFSLRTYNEKGRDVLKRWLKRAQDEGLSEQDAKDIETEMEHIYEVCKEYADSNKYAPFGQWSNATVKKGKNDKPLLSVVTPNGEYKLNLDVALVCKKRQTLDKVFDRLIKRGVFDNFDMGQEDIANINQIIVKHKFETACAICFVESKRFRQAKIAEDFANQYNELVQSMMPEGAEATYFNFGGDPRLDEHNATVTNDVSQMDKSKLDFTRLNELDKELNDKGKKATRVDNKIARYLLKHPEGRHFVNRTDFIASSGFENVKAVSPDVLSLYNSKKGSGGPKSAFGFAQYMHEILSKSNFNAKAAYAVGGVRIQSFSDFVPRMFFDYAEIVGDLATKQLPAHAYTKEEAFVKLFGLTGIKINMSLVPASVEDGQAPGLDAEGNYAWEKGQTFDYNIAIEIQKAKGYGDNCGTIAVGVSDAHIRKMMADKNIRMIIPYHKSSLNPIIAAMNGISDFTDYTTYQNTRYADGTKLSDDDAKNEVNFNVFMHEQSMDPQQAAEAYVRWCEENDYLPKFDQFAYAQDKNGEYIVENGKLKVDENYYKLLEDFTLYNEPSDPKAQRGSYVPQHEVKLRLPKDGDAFGSWQSLLTEDTYDEKGNLKYKGALKADTELDKKQNDEIDALVDDIIQNLNTPAVRERVSQEQIKARQERGDALRAAERQRYEEGLAKRKAAVQPKSESTVQYSLWKRVDPNQEQYKDWDSNSPRPVETIRPSSRSWTSGPSFADVKKRYPELFTEVPKKKNKANKKGHGSQSTSTENTYNSIFDRLEEENFDGTILDASSGQGLGTRDGKERGFSIEDVEPFPPDSEFHVPDYKDYNAIDNTYDFIISNAVLNVEPQDQRDATIVRMGELLNDGGRMYINVRGISDVEGAKTKQPVDPANHEWYIPNSRSYQKGFTAQELKAYVEDALGDEYTVETAMNGFPKPSNAVTVMVYKGNSAPQYSLSFNKNIEDIDPTKPLKTLQGSTIKRAQNNVGKEIGGQIYVHKNYASDTKIPADVLARGEELVPDDFEYNSVMWDKAKPNEIRFDEAPDFDTATEPQVGHFLKINTETGNITAGYSPNIWHHKWLWVKDDYDGFDTREAYDRSQTWLSQVKGTAKGTIKSWNKQLEENGMEPIDSEPVPKDQAFLDRFNNKPKGIFPTKEEADRQFSLNVRDTSNRNENYKEMVPKDSYIYSEEYNNTVDRYRDLHQQLDRNREEFQRLQDELKAETYEKPREEWDDLDHMMSNLGIMGFGLKEYTTRGKEIKEQINRVVDEERDLWLKIHDEEYNFNRIKNDVHWRQIADWVHETPRPATQEEYEGFDMSTTGMSYYDDALAQGTAYIAEMSPAEYIANCAFDVFESGTIESTLNGAVEENIAKYTDMMESGTKFPMPMLNYAGPNRGQEGRHRALAAYNLGIEKIPVVVYGADQYDPEYLRRMERQYFAEQENEYYERHPVDIDDITLEDLDAYVESMEDLSDDVAMDLTQAQYSISLDGRTSQNQNNQTNEVLRKMYESLGLSPHAQPMKFKQQTPETKQSKVNANTFTNTAIFDDAMKYARDSNERIRMQTASGRVREIGEYDVVTEQESMANAVDRLSKDYKGEYDRLIRNAGDEEWGSTDLDTAMGIMHSELAKGNIDAFYDTAKVVQEKGTRAGQLVQAFAKYTRTPEGVAVQALDDIEEKLGKIPPDLKERIGMLAQELRAIEDGDMDSIIELIKKQAKIRKTPIGKHTINQLYKETYQANYDRAVTQLLGIAQDEEAKHIKADAKSIGQKISTWQLVSHLLNFRTGARNVVSNTVFGAAETIANDLALIPDAIISLGTGNRTVGMEFLTPKALAAGVARARSSAIDIKLDVAPDDSRTKYGNTRRTWKMASNNPGAKVMSTLEMILGYELNVTDEFAKGMHEYRVRSGLQKWVDAGMYDEKTVDQFAEKEMLYRTFQDDTFPGMILGGIKKGLNVIGLGHTGQYLGKGQKFEVKQFGMGDLVQKYTQVPGALLSRLVEYSPAGYAKAIYNLGQIAKAKAQLSKEGKKNRPSAKKTEDLEQKLLSYQRELSLSMGRATTGAGLIQMFFALAASGLLHDEGSEDDDDQAAKNAAAVRALQGVSGTQLNLSALGRWIDNHNDDLKWKSGDTLISIDFLEPLNGLMSIAAVLAQDEYFDRDDIDYTVAGGDILHSIVNSFAQVPTMQSIQNIQNAVQYHSADSKYRVEFEVGLELLKGSVTGFVPGPVRQAAQYQDDYYRETYSSNDPIEQMRDALKNAIPGQRQTLDTKLTPYGTDKEMEDKRMRALNAFVNPGKLSEYKESELEGVLNEMDSAKLYPTRKAPNKLGFGSDKKLTASEKRKYITVMGKTYTTEMNDLIQSDDYKNASTEEQKEMMLDRKAFADMEAKSKLAEAFGTTYRNSSTVDKVLAHRDMGYSEKQWNDIEKGMTNPESGSVNQEYAKPYLDSRDDLTNAQKAEIWRAMGWVDYDKKGKKKNPYL